MSALDKGVGDKKKRRRELNKIHLGEISAVGKPAQEGAAILLAKAAPPDGEARKQDTDNALGKAAVLTTAVQGHTHLLVTEDTAGPRQNGYTGEGKMPAPAGAGGYTGYGYHDHPWYRDSAGNIVIGETLGHTHGVMDMTKGEGTTMSGNAGTTAGTGDAKAPEESQVVKDLQAQVAKLTAEADFSDDERTFYKSLDEKGQEAFRKAKPDARAEQIAKAAQADEVYKSADGKVYKASEHGAAALTLAKEVDDLKARTARSEAMAKAAAEDAELRKEVQRDFGHLPGSEDHRVALLKAAKGIEDEEARKAALELLKSRNGENAELMKTRGTSHVPPGFSASADSPVGQMEKMEKEYATAHKVSVEAAAAALAKDNADYRALYSEAYRH